MPFLHNENSSDHMIGTASHELLLFLRPGQPKYNKLPTCYGSS